MRLPPGLTLVCALVAAASGGPAARGQTTALYTANTTTATVQTGTVHVLQVVNLAQGPGTYRLDTLTVSRNFTTADPQSIRLVFYTGVDTDPNSTDVLANATALAAFGNDDPPTVGNFALTYNIPNAFTFTTTGNGAVGIEIILTATSDGSYSTTQNGRFTGSVPTLGTSAGYVWYDANLDNTFTGAERTTFGMANANNRLALTGVQLAAAAPMVQSVAHQGTTSAVTVNGYNGHTYQLQRRLSLLAAWGDVGGTQAGNAGTVLTFTNNDGTDPQAFYRVVDVSSAGTAGRIVRKTPARVQHTSSIPRLRLSTIRAD